LREDYVPDDSVNVHCIIGVKSVEIAKAINDDGKKYLYLDKGYNRDWPQWWRVSCNAQQPTNCLTRLNRPADRAARQGWLKYKPWRNPRKNDYILYAGSSAKAARFIGAPEPSEAVNHVVSVISSLTKRPICYRAKPSWRDAQPIQGASFSHNVRDIHDDLEGAAVLVTHDTSCCFDAVLAGVPSIVLNNGVARPISSTKLKDINAPYLATHDERNAFFSDLAYCQWTLEEFSNREPWRYIEEMMDK
jgi:hypothetical protein